MIGRHKVPPPRGNRWFNTPGVIGLINIDSITLKELFLSSLLEMRCLLYGIRREDHPLLKLHLHLHHKKYCILFCYSYTPIPSKHIAEDV